ncbi:MAG: NADH-quinone oxidoreductase subunit NuoF [Spirochaetales bacterium]|nr:NADH-quinone oxidoreductase subunit NuoF [Spirochaetales bacterium]
MELKERLRVNRQKVEQKAVCRISICTGGGCLASGARAVLDSLIREISDRRLEQQVIVTPTGCLGPCAAGPVLLIKPDNVFYEGVAPEDAGEIIDKHLVPGGRVERLLHKDDRTGKFAPGPEDIEFFKRQQKIVLRNCGTVNPLSINDYIEREGYQALSAVLSDYSPDRVIEEMKASGLRGRGGAGFPTWMKWNFARKAEGKIKYVLCNADEGDPGAFMDRSVLEGDPHSLIEGMAIAAYAVGSSRGYVYVRAEYPLAVERLSNAINQAREYGLLGTDILGTDFNFDLEIRMGSGAFVCGEETALMTSIEGNRGEPRPRPPFPAQKGLWSKPTVLNNVETYANVPAILLKGASWYAGFGTEKSRGTKVFALAGAVNNTGLVEVPVGTTLGELIYDIGGGIKNNKAFKAAQIGGPSGGCIPKQYLNVPLDYESLSGLGAIMGSGGLIVMDEDTCMVDVARFFLDFVQDESCGKCVPCRVGTKRMLEILTRICEGKGEMADIDRLVELGNMIRDTALCGLGQTAPNPVLSTIRHFRHEYEDHILHRHCEAAVCGSLVRAACQSGCPAHVDVPGFVSLAGEKRYEEALALHRERNPFAAVCARVCFHPCEKRCRRTGLDEPVSVKGIKRFLVDRETGIPLPSVRDNAVNAGRKVAIVGAGPAGLSCGYFLARLGYKPDIYEAESRAGGMLVQTIPAYRLPREILASEVRMVESLGVNIITGKALNRDFTLSALKEAGYEAVFLGTGAQKTLKLGIPGEDAGGVIDALRFLKQFNLQGNAPVGRKVIVVGGGNAAVDAARTALRLGAEEVTVIYRRTREEMPAFAGEIEQAILEGVVIQYLTAPSEVVSAGGKVVAVKCRRMKLGEFDYSGRRKPVEDLSEEIELECDFIIGAISQKVDISEFTDGLSIGMTGWKTVQADYATGATNVSWLFAGGDVTSGPSSVVEAIAAGERAAYGINFFLTGKKEAFWRKQIESTTNFDPDADPVMYARERLPLLPVEKRQNNFSEVELSWTEDTALNQAQRCLRCDYGKTVNSDGNEGE